MNSFGSDAAFPPPSNRNILFRSGTVVPTPQSDTLMRRALELAERGRGFVHPNPLVGAVIVVNDAIVGEGWHTAFGKPHAEIEAIRDARLRGVSNLDNATLFVTLEPCCHHGKTPPCTRAIISAGIRHVIYALDDPDPQVAGKGREELEAAGIRVERGHLSAEATQQNEAYLHHRRIGLPFLTWKTARTADGRTTTEPGRETAITGPIANQYVDELRARADAVLVGIETVITDDPGLRVRDAAVRTRAGSDPWRVVFDTQLRVPRDCSLLRDNEDHRTLIVTAVDRATADAAHLPAEIICVPAAGDHIDLREAARALAQKGLIDILVEAGDTLGRALYRAGLLRRLIILHADGAAHGTPAHADLIASGLTALDDRLGADHRIIIELPEPA